MLHFWDQSWDLRVAECPCDMHFIEWLEDQGYEPEVQVSKKGEVASRGGIIDETAPEDVKILTLARGAC